MSYRTVGGRGVGSDVEPQAEGQCGGKLRDVWEHGALRDCMARVVGGT